MSRAASVVSEFSAVTSASSGDVGTNSLLQTCVYVKDLLDLDVYNDDSAATTFHVKISSRTLKKSYVLSGCDVEEESGGSSPSGCIDELFEKLAELVKGLKEKNCKPPKSDFVCFSSLKYNKVFLDVDCVSCKDGKRVTDKRHFSSTKLLNVILSAVARTFDVDTLDDSVYLTNGKSTCGYHVFFNTLAYRYEDASAAKEMLFRELDFALARADLNCIRIDRNCTQMPLPTSLHANSSNHTTPYRMIRICKDQWKRETMRWQDMDAELLKCFSCIAFSRNHRWTAVPKKKAPASPPSQPAAAPMPDFADDTDSVSIVMPSAGDRKRKATDTPLPDAVEAAKKSRATPNVPSDEDDCSVMTATQSGGDCESFVVPAPYGENGVSRSADEEDDASALTAETSTGGRAASFVLPGTTDKGALLDASLSWSKNATAREDGGETSVSAFTNNSEADDAASFAVPLPPPPVFRKPNGKPIKRKSNGCAVTFDPDSGSCKFVDKQYKNSLLRAEEDEAITSRANLARSDGVTSRIYVLPGNSLEEARKYKLLVRLENVKRAVYAGDKFGKREWTDIKVAYYDQHLNNPVILKIFDFVFNDDRVKDLFEPSHTDQILRSIARLMAPFETDRGDKKGRLVFPNDAQREEKEARACKSCLIGALTRVCTNLFVVITAVVSDFRKIQNMKKYRNQTFLNCTVVDDRQKGGGGSPPSYAGENEEEDEDEPDCSASTFGGRAGEPDDAAAETGPSDKKETVYALLASLIAYEENNLSDHALYALLYYYHYFPIDAMTKLMNEVQHDGLMVTVMIRYFLVYEHRRKPLTLLEIFHGFNDVSVALWGPEKYLLTVGKNTKKDAAAAVKGNSKQNNRNPNPPRSRNATESGDDSSNGFGGDDNNALDFTVAAAAETVSREDVEKLLSGHPRRRKMVSQRTKTSDGEDYVKYEWKEEHMWQAVVNYYLRPVVMHDDRLVFANDGYDTVEEDAIESFVAHVAMRGRITKSDVATAFKDARTLWRMPHGSQLIYESDLVSDRIGCCFHINVALKIYETFCGGCLTRMKRVYNNYLIDNTRFNMGVYDVVAECRTATVNLTAAVDRSYVNLLLCQPVVPAVFEDLETRQLFMSDEEMKRGSFCCLTTMDYIRALNLFERANCQSKFELEACDYVERFLDDMYTGDIAADGPPNLSADAAIRLLYAFYSLYIYEVTFHMRHAYATRENVFVSIERLCAELDVRELLVLFFGESSMTRVGGLPEDVDRRIRKTADELSAKKLSSPSASAAETAEQGRFDVRPVLAADIPDKVARMKALFGQFGFDIMREDGCVRDDVGEANSSDDYMNDGVGGGDDYGDEIRADGSAATVSPDWNDESKFEDLFYASDDWLENLYKRVGDRDITGKNSRNVPTLSSGKGKGATAAGGSRYSGQRLFLAETVRTVMRLQLKRNIDHDRLGKLYAAVGDPALNRILVAMKSLPMRLKLVAFVLTTHTIKLKTTRLATEFVDSTYRDPHGLLAGDERVFEGEVNDESDGARNRDGVDPPENVWFKRTENALGDRRALLLHARWMAEKRFKNNFFVGLDPVLVYDVLYDYMRSNREEYPAFKRYIENIDTRTTAQHLCTAMMFLLVMSAYDQEVLELYLKMFLAVEWPGQWAKTIFVWKSNSNAGKSYLFDSIIKRACAKSTCINDPKGGKENAPEKAEYVRNFVLFANEFSQANSNELKKIVSESTFKFRMNYGNMMNEIYATGKIMVNCNTLPPTSDEAAINRMTLFSMPFWFSKRQSISDALLNWTRGHNVSDRDHWEMAYRYELPSLFTDKEKEFLKAHDNTKNEADLFDGYVALRPNMFSGNMDFSKATASLFLVQNKISRLYVASPAPPTERIVHGLVNITRHFSWLRFLNQLDAPVDFTILPAASEAVRSEWLSLTLPYQEWKLATGARHDPTCRAPAATVNRSLQAFASRKNVNYFGIRQFFETDFASSREAIEDVYYVRFDTKAFME